MTSRIKLSLTMSLLAACGGGDKPPTVIIDMPGMDGPTFRPGCDYEEQTDATNDAFFTGTTGTAETTPITFTGEKVICGTIDSTHFANNIVDIDSYLITVAQGIFTVSVSGPGTETLAGIRIIADVPVAAGGDPNVRASGDYAVNHAIAWGGVGAGMMRITVSAANPAAISAPIRYKIVIKDDAGLGDPGSRCAFPMTPNFMEQEPRGGVASLNDVIDINFPGGGQPMTSALTPNANDIPEQTSITTVPGTPVMIAGAANSQAAADSYRDRDTFEFATDATTNQLTAILFWEGDNAMPPTPADFDFFLFNKDVADPEIHASTSIADGSFEIMTVAINPSQSYWLWAGPFDTNADGGMPSLPQDYQMILCAATFVPPAID